MRRGYWLVAAEYAKRSYESYESSAGKPFEHAIEFLEADMARLPVPDGVWGGLWSVIVSLGVPLTGLPQGRT